MEKTEAGRGACREDRGGGGKGVRNAGEAARGVGAQGRRLEDMPGKAQEAGQPATLAFLPGRGVWQPGATATGLESRRAGRRGSLSGHTPLGPPVWVSAGHR